MWPRLILALALFASAASAVSVASTEELRLDRYECFATSPHHASCQMYFKGKVSTQDMLFLRNVRDIDQLTHNGVKLAQTGFRYQGKFYARFLPRTYLLQNIAGQVDPVLTLDAESLFEPGAGIFPDSTIKLVKSDKEWGLQAKTMAIPFFLSLFCCTSFLMGIWYRGSSTPKDGWLWGDTDESTFYFSCIFALFLNSEIPKVLVPSFLSAEQFLHIQSAVWMVLVFALSQLICQSIFSDPSALERIRSRSTWLDHRLSWAAGYFFLAAVVICSLELGGKDAFSYAIGLQITGLAAVSAARLWQTRFSRVLRRSWLPGVHLYCVLLALASSLILAALFKTEWIIKQFSPFTWLVAAALFMMVRRHRMLRALERECEEFVLECKDQYLQDVSSHERLQNLAGMVQEQWEGARVSVVSLRGDQGILLASMGPMALDAHAGRPAKRAGPLVRRVCREKHLLYAPISEELGRDLSDQGLRYSTIAIPFLECDNVAAVLLFMAHEGERIPPRDALCMQWMGEKLQTEFLSAIRLAIDEYNIGVLRKRIEERDGLAFETRDPWERPQEQTQALTDRIVIKLQLPRPLDTTFNQVLIQSPQLAIVHKKFERELLNSWNHLRKQYEFVIYEAKGNSYFVAPKQFSKSVLLEQDKQKVAWQLAKQMQRTAQSLLQKDAYLCLHCQVSALGLWQGDLNSSALSRFSEASALQMDQQIYIDPENKKLYSMLVEGDAVPVRLANAA